MLMRERGIWLVPGVEVRVWGNCSWGRIERPDLPGPRGRHAEWEEVFRGGTWGQAGGLNGFEGEGSLG